MAFSVKLTGVGLAPSSTWVEDMVCWWPERELKNDPRFRRVEADPGYVDFVAVLAPSEAVALHEKYAKDLGHAFYYERIQTLGARLHQEAPALCWVLVNIYEWESGL